MRLKSEFYKLVDAYLPKDGMLPSAPSVPLEGAASTCEPLDESEESISDYSSSDEDYNLTNETSVLGGMDEDIGSTDDFFESSQDYTPSQSINEDMETERQQLKKAAEEALTLGGSIGIEDAHSRPESAGVEQGVISASADGNCDDELPDIRWNS